MYRLLPESKALCGALTGKTFATLPGRVHDIHAVPVANRHGHVFAAGSDRALIWAAGQLDLTEELAGGGIKDAESFVALGGGEKPRAVCLDCYAVHVWPDVDVTKHFQGIQIQSGVLGRNRGGESPSEGEAGEDPRTL